MIRRLFTDIADGYDRLNRILSLGRDASWRRRAAAFAGGSPERIVDLACGTGDLTLALARRFPAATLVGIDLTPAMLALARRKCTAPRFSFREGDAQRLDLPADSADLVTCAFGFRNFPDPAAALRECRRILRPGGELVVLEFFRPRSRLLGAATRAWLVLASRLFCARHADAYRHLRDSIATTLGETEFVALAEAAGLVADGRRFFIPCCTLLRLTASPVRRRDGGQGGEGPAR